MDDCRPLKKISKNSPPCVEAVIMVFLNQISFKYYENLGIYYILYYLDIHQKELKSIYPLFLNPGAWLLFVGRSTAIGSWGYGWRIDITSHVAVVTSLFLRSCSSWSSQSGSAILCFHIHNYRPVPKHGQLSYHFFHTVSMDDGLIGPWRSSYIQHQDQQYMK